MLARPQPVTLRRIDVLADDDVNEDLINLHHHKAPFDTLPTLLRDYRVEARAADGTWRTVSRTTATGAAARYTPWTSRSARRRCGSSSRRPTEPRRHTSSPFPRTRRSAGAQERAEHPSGGRGAPTRRPG
ncbi:hypothetical protein ACFVT1_23405 [Streptomyces sp. NPDC057963]|uniref:hypothetical protein n=1 Tax=Streptomyces sp. NPDC057963 TaxID=3346290 RepID=UPI0036EE08E7